jgi:hypothetical protein
MRSHIRWMCRCATSRRQDAYATIEKYASLGRGALAKPQGKMMGDDVHSVEEIKSVCIKPVHA